MLLPFCILRLFSCSMVPASAAFKSCILILFCAPKPFSYSQPGSCFGCPRIVYACIALRSHVDLAHRGSCFGRPRFGGPKSCVFALLCNLGLSFGGPKYRALLCLCALGPSSFSLGLWFGGPKSCVLVLFCALRLSSHSLGLHAGGSRIVCTYIVLRAQGSLLHIISLSLSSLSSLY